MRWVFAALVVVHGGIHLLGFAKAFGLYDPPQLAHAISRPWGVAWLVAAAAMLATALAFLLGARAWWAVALGAALLSQIVIVSAWGDAKFGTVANLLIVAGAVYGLASQGPTSFSAQYRSEVAERIGGQPPAAPLVTEESLAHLPEPVQRYLRLAKVVGQPRVRYMVARLRGRIRNQASDPWMPFEAEQHNFPGEPARFFWMKARRSGLPVDVYHAFEGGSASMRVRLVSLVPMVDARGPEMDQAETVTVFNDLCLFTPSELVDPAIRWEAIDQRSARAYYTVGERTISAVLFFDESGDLVNFVSDDRRAASADGTLVPMPWSTPVRDHRELAGQRVATRGEGRWHAPEGDYTYIELELVDLEIYPPRR